MDPGCKKTHKHESFVLKSQDLNLGFSLTSDVYFFRVFP